MHYKIIEKISNIVNEGQFDINSIRENLEKIYEGKEFSKIIDDYDESLNLMPSSKIPHYTFIFYLSLVILFLDDLENIARYIKPKKSFRFLCKGASLFVGQKSIYLKYDAKLNDDYFKNKYEFIDRFEGEFVDPNNIMFYVIYLLKLIYYADRKSLIDIINEDNQNLFFLTSITDYEIKFTDEELIDFLNSNDELKINGALYRLTYDFNYAISQYAYDKNENNSKKVDEQTKRLNKVFGKLDENKKVYLIVNFIFAEKYYPIFFFDILKESKKEFIIDNLKKQDLENLYKLINLRIFIEQLKYEEIKKLFVDFLIIFIKNDGNKYVWQEKCNVVLDILKLMSDDLIVELKKQLEIINSNLFISNFDRQIRYNKYLKDLDRYEIINYIIKLL